MLKLRLQRRGKNNYATFRVVVAEDRAPIKGRYIADVGHYNPHTDVFSVKADEVSEWMQKGAQPTPTVHNLLIEHKVIAGEKVKSWRPKASKSSEDSKSSETQPSPEATAGTASKASESSDDTPKAEEKPEEAKPEIKTEEKEEKTGAADEKSA